MHPDAAVHDEIVAVLRADDVGQRTDRLARGEAEPVDVAVAVPLYVVRQAEYQQGRKAEDRVAYRVSSFHVSMLFVEQKGKQRKGDGRDKQSGLQPRGEIAERYAVAAGGHHHCRQAEVGFMYLRRLAVDVCLESRVGKHAEEHHPRRVEADVSVESAGMARE